MALREDFLIRWAMGLKEMFLVLFLLLSLTINGNGVEGKGSTSLSKEEDMEIERLLKIINKPAVKTIKDGYGQIFSCVDIEKQPAFDHPLLMNHKIQMGPGSLPKVIKDKKASSLGVSLKIGLKDGGCPLGTVPIRRITKEELKRAKSSPNFEKGYPSNAQDPSNDQAKFHFALQSKDKDGDAVFGSRAVLNTWQPNILGNQSSSSLVILRDASPPEQTRSIHAGWVVSSALYHNFLPHLSTAWTNDNHQKTGCYDVLCPGFVQISRDLPLGIGVSPTSIYDGTQYYIILTVYKDPLSEAWWLLYGDEKKKVGYWPKVLFNSTFADHADVVQWGGIVYNAGVLPWPEMGSGHNAKINTEYRKDCYIGGMNLIGKDGDVHPVTMDTPRRIITSSPCYEFYFGFRVPGVNYAVLFGGPGGNNC
ncbi:protein neprosin-like [Tasmannia lanceolata]|uniref:protein neprosin-like n=1 Tax=Tasmannia lanceolata TaxID=3420 RepID=UPI0040636E13